MPELGYRVLRLLCVVVQSVPQGTNLGLVGLLGMLASGRCAGEQISAFRRRAGGAGIPRAGGARSTTNARRGAGQGDMARGAKAARRARP
jgi:hypothetical protein